MPSRVRVAGGAEAKGVLWPADAGAAAGLVVGAEIGNALLEDTEEGAVEFSDGGLGVPGVHRHPFGEFIGLADILDSADAAELLGNFWCDADGNFCGFH